MRFYESGDIENAFRLYREENELLDSNSYSIFTNLANLGVCSFRLKKFPEAINYLKASKKLTEKINSATSGYFTFGLGTVGLYLGASYKELDNIDSCAKYYLFGVKMRDQAAYIRNQKDRLLIDKRFELQRKEQEIQNLAVQIEEENYRKRLWLAISILMFIILALIIFLLRYISKAAANAKRLSDHREKLLQVLSHDLLGAINQVVGFTKIYKYAKAELGNAEFEAIEKKFVSSAVAVESTMRNILTWGHLSKADALSYQPIQLCELIKQITTTYAALADDKGLTLRADCPDVVFQSDPFHLSALIRNLVYNAIKHGEVDSAINIKTYIKDHHLHFVIENQANPDDLLLVQQIVQQLQNHPQTISTGFGLEIIARSLMLLKGQIKIRTVESRAQIAVMLPDANA